jgi:hypothetical protein
MQTPLKKENTIQRPDKRAIIAENKQNIDVYI